MKEEISLQRKDRNVKIRVSSEKGEKREKVTIELVKEDEPAPLILLGQIDSDLTPRQNLYVNGGINLITGSIWALGKFLTESS